MDLFRKAQSLSALVIVMLSVSSALSAQDGAQADFERGYFLQTHDRDAAAAAAAYEKVLANPTASQQFQSEARARLAECREDLVSADFARLMPPDVIAYAEISNPGEHIARLAEMMGLVRNPADEATEPKSEATPLGNGAFFPDDFALNPALLAGLRAFRGAAVAVTGLDPQDRPDGLLVLHPGEAELMRGVLGTAVQFAEPAEPIEGFKTYRLNGEAWVTVTARLFLISPTREQVVAAVGRLRDAKADSLASRDEIVRLKADREGSLLFAYIDGPRSARELKRHLGGHEGHIMQALLDLDHIDSVSAAMRTTDAGFTIQAQAELMDGHRNLIYGMIRTAPCSRQSLEHVPGGAAAVVLLGLNPAAPQPVGDQQTSDGTGSVTAMDIGREVFANLEEIAFFVSPLAGGPDRSGPPMPDMGLVLIAKDAARSEALWGQLLSLPAMLIPTNATAGESDVEGLKAREFRFPDAPPILLARPHERAVLIGTRGAVAGAIHANKGNGSIVQDTYFRPLLERLTPNSSKAVLVHVGRVADIAATVVPGRDAEHLRLAASLLSNLRVAAVTDEAPTRLTVRVEASGLPNVPEAVRKLAVHFGEPAADGALAKSPDATEQTPPAQK